MSARSFLIVILALAFATLVAGCPASIHGNLHITVSGTNNQPLSGAKVVSSNQPEGQLKVTGITGADGVVTFNGIKSGNYTFNVSRFNYQPKDFTIFVAAGRNTNFSISLLPAP